MSFFEERVDHLGFTVSAHRFELGKEKIICVANFPEPTDLKGLKSCLGLTGYFRRFVKGFAIIARPLSDLLKKNNGFKLREEQINAFRTSKFCLLNKPILAAYNPHARTEVHTDACKIGFGACLLQEQNDEKLHPVSYYSRKTIDDEAEYHVFELEALAIVSALEPSRVYSIGIFRIVRTDCNSLKYLEVKREMNPRIARWFFRLSEYDYKIDYPKAEHNVVADALSRNPVDPAEEVEMAGLPVLGIRMNTDWIAAMQRNSEEILAIRDKLEAGDEETHAKLIMRDARVY